PSPQKSSVKRTRKHKRFSRLLGVLVSLGLIAILAFVVVTLLILRSQGISQARDTLTIISIVVGFVISVLSLLISFLQWHHPQREDRPESSTASHLQASPNASLDTLSSPSISTTSHQQNSSINRNTKPPDSLAKGSHSIDWGEAPDSEQ